MYLALPNLLEMTFDGYNHIMSPKVGDNVSSEADNQQPSRTDVLSSKGSTTKDCRSDSTIERIALSKER